MRTLHYVASQELSGEDGAESNAFDGKENTISPSLKFQMKINRPYLTD
jgi:hypothetical protein